MMRKIHFIAFTLILTIQLAAVFNDYEPSPRARAMGGAYHTLSNDAYGIFYNPAGFMNAPSNLAISYSRLFSNDFQVLNSAVISLPLPGKWGNLAFGLQSMDVDYQGVSLLSEKTYAVAHAVNILKDVHSSFDFGYTISIYHLAINTMGDDTAIGINVGGLATLHQRTRIGFTVANLNNPEMGKDNDEDLPQKITVGIAYEPYDQVFTSLELEKAMDGETEIHGGTEVQVFEPLKLRFGLRNEPTQYSLGARFTLFDIMVDYAFSTHATLKDTHQFGIGYKF